MIISGANAGGKTVVLKTAGLLSLMAISGLPVPASEARIPFYRSVLADIGDHQSLAANLSTFSSHMSNIAGMIRECVPPSLVLLDEAGTGTDPRKARHSASRSSIIFAAKVLRSSPRRIIAG